MSINELFKYDVRIRERMLERKQLTESELASYLEGLRDVESEASAVSVSLPAPSDAEPGAASESGEEAAPKSTELP